jgi:hypothetical protein
LWQIYARLSRRMKGGSFSARRNPVFLATEFSSSAAGGSREQEEMDRAVVNARHARHNRLANHSNKILLHNSFHSETYAENSLDFTRTFVDAT